MIKNYLRGSAYAFAGRMLLLLWACLLSGAAFAQISTTKTYYIKSVSTGKAVTDGGSTANNTAITTADYNAADQGQRWCLVKSGSDINGYAIVNEANTYSAIDVAPDANDKYYLVHWQNKSYEQEISTNQQLIIRAVDTAADTYRIFWSGNTSMAVNVQDDGRLRLTTDIDTESSLFTFEAEAEGYLNQDSTYYIKPYGTDLVLSNGASGENDASVFAEAVNAKSNGQKWMLGKAATGVYIIKNAGYPSKAIDANPTGNYKILQWTASTSSDNQQFTFKAVEGKENVYQILWNKNTTLALTLQSDNSLLLASDLSAEATYFTFETTTPQERDNWSYWQDETIYGENKLDGHATFMPYASTSALKADTEHYAKPWLDPQGAEWMTLNGVWHLQWTSDMSSRPSEEAYWADTADVSAWDTISVPSCLEMKGYGDPYYINVEYAFEDSYPYITMKSGCKNGLASYRRTFTLPDGWETGKRVVLHFDGIYSAAYVWVNGHYVGYTEEANNDAEFDLSKVVRKGENNICVQVIRFSDGSYLEGQDMWRMSGMHRDVYLYATPETYICDHVVSATLDTETYTTGTLAVTLDMDNTAGVDCTKKVKATLYAPDGTQVGQQTADFSLAAQSYSTKQTLNFDAISNVETWSAEKPNLYTLEISQLTADGTEEMAFATKVGFRTIEIKESKLYVNGQMVYLKGVNAQDTHVTGGRTVPASTLLRDIQLMKQANMNTFRCSHYPRQPKMYAMFDYYGMYVMDEADVECHYNWENTGNTISRADSWQAQYVDRTERMVLRDRNHPSVAFWSLGNESGTGQNLQASYNRCKELDSRYVHYEGATRGGASYTDFYSVMYPSIANCQSGANTSHSGKPYFMCEFAHSMGNGTGNFKEYLDIIENSSYGIGGCVWDWVDQSIYDADDIKKGNLLTNGFDRYMSGGDYGGPNQGNFVNDGLIPADRSFSPKLAEVKQVYQYAKFGTWKQGDKTLCIKNAYAFTNLSDYNLVYSILENGTEVETHATAMQSIACGDSARVSIPYTTSLEDGKEYCLNVQLVLKEATAWADADYPVAAHQVVLQERPETLADVETSATDDPLTITDNQYGNKIVSNNKVSMLFDKTTGRLREWSFGTYKLLKNLLSNTFDPTIYRWVENDNTATNSTDEKATDTQTYTLVSAPALQSDGSVKVTSKASGTYFITTYTYTIYPSGTVDLEMKYAPQSISYSSITSDPRRRIGTEVLLPSTLENVEYYARGPWDNFCDRKEASFLGRYNTTVTDMLENIPRPQTTGNRLDMRELLLTDTDTTFTLKIESEGKVDFQLLHYTDEVMASVHHRWNLSAKPTNTVLHLDYTQRGLGNGSCGQGTQVLSKYYVPTSSTLTNKVRFSEYVKKAQGIHAATQTENTLSVKITSDGQVTCTGAIPAGTVMKVYDLGGACLATASTSAATTSLSTGIAAQPRGTYIVKVGGVSYKVVK